MAEKRDLAKATWLLDETDLADLDDAIAEALTAARQEGSRATREAISARLEAKGFRDFADAVRIGEWG